MRGSAIGPWSKPVNFHLNDIWDDGEVLPVRGDNGIAFYLELLGLLLLAHAGERGAVLALLELAAHGCGRRKVKRQGLRGLDW